jgi:LPS-assembly protein
LTFRHALIIVVTLPPALWAATAHAQLDPNVPRLRVDPQLTAPKPSDKPGAGFFRAKEIDGDANTDTVEARGEVQFRTRREVVYADWARYVQGVDTIDAKGNVRWRSIYDTVTTDWLTYSPSSEKGTAGHTDFELGRFGGRGKAEALRFEGSGRYGMDTAEYTTCKGLNPAWCMIVDKLEIDSDNDRGRVEGAKVVFYGVPVFYWPGFDFPLGKERKSGFLSPTYGSTGNRGFEFLLPYYVNLAPNYDATLSPRLMTKRGVQLGAEFRYLFDTMKGTVNGEYLPNDRVTGTQRNALTWRHSQTLAPNLALEIDARRVSDDTYFVDLADRVSATSTTTLPRFVTLAYSWNDWALHARVQRYQSLQDPTAIAPFTPPYEKVPEFSAVRTWNDLKGFEATINAAITRFEHPFLTPGVRSLLVNSLSYPYRTPGAFVVPKVSLHATDYRLDTKDLDFADTTRVLPIASLDSGLVFERDTSLFGKSFLQTLEPRAFFTYIPYKAQSKIPNFDSAPIDFNFAQLFQENRYSGNDRIGDTTQMTLAVSSRYLEPSSGRERVRASLGSTYYFNNQRVSLGETVREQNRSDLLAFLGVRPNESFSLDSAMQFNSTLSRTERATISARYSPEPRKSIAGSYRYIREIIEGGNKTQVKQIDVSAQWPLEPLVGKLGQGWYGVGRVNYSVPEQKVVEAIGGVEYDGDCWVGRLVVQRIATGVQKATNSVFWQIELNGLSRIGTNPLDVLKRNIPGYQQLNTLEAGRRRQFVPSDVFQPLD